MKRPSFLHGVVVAAIFGFLASVIVATLTPFVGLSAVIRLVIPVLGAAYLFYLFSRSPERVGRVTTITMWSALAIAAWWLAPPLPLYLLTHVIAVWLVRSLYFYSGFVPALIDLGLSALSVSATMWAVSRSGSVFLATWCFFLVQALWAFLPRRLPAKGKNKAKAQDNTRFESARRRADAALRQLFSLQG
jgi:hypothetical protein